MPRTLGDAFVTIRPETSGFSSKLKKGVMVGVAAVGATAGAALALGIAKNMEFDAANDKLRASMGLTGKDAARAGKVAGQLYANNMSDSMDGANEAVKAVVQQMNVSVRSASLKPLATQAIGLANILGEDVGPVAAAAGQMLKTGLAKSGKQAFDILTRGAQLGANKAGDLLDTFNEYGTQFRKLGIDGKTAMGLIQQGLQGGARDADLVADSIKEFSIRAVDGSKTTAQGFRAIGLSGKSMAELIAKGGAGAKRGLEMTLDGLRAIKDPAERSRVAVKLFGTQAEDMGKALYKLDGTKAAGELGKVKDATKKAVHEMGDNAQSKIDGMKHKIELWTASLVNAKGPLGNVAAAVVGFGGPVMQAASSLSVMAMALKGTKAAELATAAASKVMAVGQRILNAAMRANPIGIVITALAALAAGLVYAYKHSETFRNIVNGAFHAVATAGKWLWNNVLMPVFKFIVNAWLNVAGAIVHGAAKAFGWVPGIGPKLKGVAASFDKFKDQVNNSLSKLRDPNVSVGVSVNSQQVAAALTQIRHSGSGGGSQRGQSREVFWSGGYTGHGGKYEPAGEVHRGEFVSDAETTKRARPLLEALHRTKGRLRGYARGGLVGLSGTGGALSTMDRFVSGMNSSTDAIAETIGKTLGASLANKVNDYAKRIARQQRYSSIGGGARVWPLPHSSWSTYPGHDGIDLNTAGQDYGKPFYAAASGRISYVGWNRGYGDGIFERGSYGELVYGHSSRPLVHAGQVVRAGQVLGLVGSTGHSTGPHLHIGFPGGTSSQILSFLHNAKGAPFDFGGLARGRGFIPKAINAPERVLSPRETKAFERAMDRGFGGDGPTTVNIYDVDGRLMGSMRGEIVRDRRHAAARSRQRVGP